MDAKATRTGDPSDGLGYAQGALDRRSDLRADAAAIAALRERPDARALALSREVAILRAGSDRATLPRGEAEALGAPVEEAFLGLDAEGPVFVFGLPDDALDLVEDPDPGALIDRRKLVVPGRSDLAAVDLRALAQRGLTNPAEVGIAAQGKALVGWHRRHRFCANCGAPTKAADAGWRRDCAACGAQHFPRTDPVVIMLATRGGRCLLGRQARFPVGMYSALAGFMEPGETVEQAVRRELGEEAGVACGAVRYHSSQPWPFPANLMIGCFAEALDDRLTVDGKELEDARWFGRDEIAAMLEGRHPGGLTPPGPIAIAHRLLSVWAAGGA